MTKKRVAVSGTELVDGGDIDLDIEDLRLADGTRHTEERARALAEVVVQADRR